MAKSENASIGIKNKNIIRVAIATVFVLLIPLIAMQFSDEVVWGVFDFVFIGTLLFGAGLTYEYVAKKMNNSSYRAAVGVAVVTAVLLVWINGAVGIIGDGDLDGPNGMYLVVLAVGIISAFVTRFRSRGMSRALFTTALAQILITVIAVIIWRSEAVANITNVIGVNIFFATLWTVSGFLFQSAGATELKK